MDSFEFYLKEYQKTINKIVVKNNSDETKLFKILNNGELVKLLIVKRNSQEEVAINEPVIDISVEEVKD